MFKERIQENYKQLTPGFRKLADHILENAFNVAFLTSEELARTVNVEHATVAGFCRELGYTGYEDLVQEIKSQIHQQIVTTYHDIRTLEKTEFLTRVQNTFIQNLQKFHAIQTATLVRVCEALDEAPYIWATGDYSSYDIAAIFVRGLQAFERPATVFHATASEAAIHFSRMQAGEALFTVASKHHDVVDAGYTIKLAREKGLRTICLVVASAETIAREAEMVLTIPTPDVTTPVNLGMPLAIISTILEALVAQDKNTVVNRFGDMFTYFGQLREMRAQKPERE
ncbi:MAG: MurR/RpiR family transcriptional regulator [Anaerolineae bacterium]|nr:MurR/RpiR family transcriptional regulator [Anaerolineae bacterium]